MRLLAADLSFKSAGIACGGAGASPWSTVISSGRGARAENFHHFRTEIRKHIINARPEMVVFERPFLASNAGSNPETLRVMVGLSAIVEEIAAAYKLPAHDVAPMTWRKMFLGNGRPKNPKGEALRMCDLLGWYHGGVHDRAEAMGIWGWGQWAYGDRAAIMRQLSETAVLGMARQGRGQERVR